MAQNAIIATSSIAPPHQSVALAVTLLKSKPAGISARQHILQLRNHLKFGQQNFSEPELGRYLDLVAYWQQRCKESEEKCAQLKSEVVTLERTNQMLDNYGRNENSDAPAPSTKRKKASLPARRSNRIKAPQPPVKSVEEKLDDDFDILGDLGTDGRNLVEHIWTFQRLFQRPTWEPQAICSSLTGTLSALGRVFATIANRHDHLADRTREKTSLPDLRETKSEFSSALTACARTFSLVLLGLSILDDDNSLSRRLLGLIIYECVQMFSAGLEAIGTAARQTAAKHMTAPQPKKNSCTASTIDKESLSARGIAHTLVSLMSTLERSDPLHQRIFDGFTFVLFERVGKQLFYCTFGRHRGTTAMEDIALPVNPPDSADITRQGTEALAIRFEVKALVLILEWAMGLATKHMNPQTAIENPRNPTRLNRTLSLKTLPVSKSRLNPLAKERLQRTLILCMFGEKIEDEFLDVLSKPVCPLSLPSIPKMKEEDIDKWYQQKVWSLVGWDVLARDNESMV